MTAEDTCRARAFPFPQTHPMDVEPVYAELRADQPVVRIVMPHGGHAWLATSYATVKTVFTDPRFSRAAAGSDAPRLAVTPVFGGSVNALDGEDHKRLRLIIAPAFTGSALARLRPHVQDITDHLLQRITDHGAPADLVADFSEVLPLMIICDVLGVAYEDRSLFRAWSNTMLARSTITAEQYTDAERNLCTYITELLKQRPTQGILGLLVTAHDQGRISTKEMVDLAGALLIVGHSTLVSQISKSLYFLLTHPGHWAQLVADPTDLAPTLVEELMRYVPLGIGAALPRIAIEDVELSGVLIKTGEAVFVARHSANRDQAVFDDPEVFNPRRTPNPHLGFGFGPHICAGGQLARLEMQIALASVARHLPTLRLSIPADKVPWLTAVREQRPTQLPVTW